MNTLQHMSLVAIACSTIGVTACGEKPTGVPSVGTAILTIDGQSRQMDHVACSTGAEYSFVITYAGDDIKRDDYVNLTMYPNSGGPVPYKITIVWDQGGNERVWTQSAGTAALQGKRFFRRGPPNRGEKVLR